MTVRNESAYEMGERFRQKWRSKQHALAFEEMVMSLNEADIQDYGVEYWIMMDHIADYIAGYKPNDNR